MADWGDYGPAEFDRRLMPRGAKIAPPQQAGLFAAAREPVSKPTQASGELPGQGAMVLFPEPARDDSECLEWQ